MTERAASGSRVRLPCPGASLDEGSMDNMTAIIVIPKANWGAGKRRGAHQFALALFYR